MNTEKLLHIDSSALGASSVSRQLTAATVARLHQDHPGMEVVYRDLDADPLPHLTASVLTRSSPEDAEIAVRALDEFLAADLIVMGAPMYNFSIPSTLKAWIDRVAVAGKTFRYTESGPEGLAGDKGVIVVSSRGGVHGPATDFQEAYLRQLFAFLGIDRLVFVRAEGVAFSVERRTQAIDQALNQIEALAVQPECLAA